MEVSGVMHRSSTMRPFLILTALVLAHGLRAEESPVALSFAEDFLKTRFQQLDLDHDGRLSAAESKSVAAYVAGADANADGFITAEELQAHFRSRAGAGLQTAVRKLVADSVAGLDIEEQF